METCAAASLTEPGELAPDPLQAFVPSPVFCFTLATTEAGSEGMEAALLGSSSS